MNALIEEIRKRIKAASDNTEAGPYDEFESGQGVGLATALQIIDEVVKEHPVPADVQEAALSAYPVKEKLNYKGTGKYDKNYQRRGAYASGMLAERERLMKEAVEIGVSNVGILQMGSILTDKGIFAGDTIQAIIIKKEK